MRTRRIVTVTEAVVVACDPATVFDYTQDYGRRTEWDAGIAEATVIATDPRTVRVRIPGLGTMTVVYRLDRRPERTSAAFEDVDSRWIAGGGGAWQYEPIDGGTRWQQTNSLECRPVWYARVLAPLIERGLRASTRRAMAEAKRRLEAGER
ncbi:MAG TPA: SRPBCC family protein [Candidatus Limnocylindrales bacterium]